MLSGVKNMLRHTVRKAAANGAAYGGSLDYLGPGSYDCEDVHT